MHEDLILNTELVLYFIEVRSEVVVSAHMSDEDGVVDLDRSALLLEAEVRIDMIDDPAIIENHILGGQGGLLSR